MNGWRLTLICVSAALWVTSPGHAADHQDSVDDILKGIGIAPGICVLVEPTHDRLPVELARASQLLVYVQSADDHRVTALRTAADRAGLLGLRVFVARGEPAHIHLADNVADAVVVSAEAANNGIVPREELLRVLRPGGRARIGAAEIVKPFPAGTDDWSHPYHGPDNNPQSTDTIARAPYLTQFLAEPLFGPMPQVTVISGGRIFKAFGHVAFKQREWPLLNTVVAINGYNGALLWQRELPDGFMIHRNTMIATTDTLYLADDVSCKLIDAATGEIRDQIVPPRELADDRVWKWMALAEGTLYALLGGPEHQAIAVRGKRDDSGWPWTGMGKGYTQYDYPWGFGHTLVAIDPKKNKVLWSRTEEELLDSRATCMAGGRLFFYSHGNFIGCLDANTGKLLWKTSDGDLLAAIGEHDRTRSSETGFSSSCYVKCSDRVLYFAGPQRRKLVAVSADDGRHLWEHDDGNFQLVLRDRLLYAFGRLGASKKFDPLSGKVLEDLACDRFNCTRVTGSIDSLFTRGTSGGPNGTGTQRIVLPDDKSTFLRLMRPSCQDGVLVAGGLLYWGPWVCDCNLQLFGVICLGPAGDFAFQQPADTRQRLERSVEESIEIADFDTSSRDWLTYRADNARQSGTSVATAGSIQQLWQYTPQTARKTTAPVAAGGLVLVSGADGAVRAVDAVTGRLRWTAYTGGPVHYPPAIWQGRVYVGSGDGWVYAFQANDGHLLWRFRAAPTERRIPVYGSLASTWPVAGGVVVQDGVVYAAAGITSYDGTHVYALDAITGEIRWQNNTSGRLIRDDLVTGVSVQGHLLLHEERLYLAGGNVVSPAIYDTQDGKCLNQLDSELADAPRGQDLILVGDRVLPAGRLLYGPGAYDAYDKAPTHARHLHQSFVQASAGDVLVRSRSGRVVRIAPESASESGPSALWNSYLFARTDAVAVTSNAVLVSGQLAREAGQQAGSHNFGAGFALAAFDVDRGQPRWIQPLPSPPARWGLAVDREGRILVTLESGSLLCFGAKAG